jgi:hypothetical protein
MSDVVPFPGVTDATGASDDAGELDRNERDAEAFRDLEGPISDCRVMAQIAHQIASDEKGLSAELTYSIFHTLQLLNKLEADYQAMWHGEVTP